MARFENVSCSQCGRDFGPGDRGFSHCGDHRPAAPSFSPAPWQVEITGNVVCVVDAEGMNVCEVGFASSPLDMADAALIAAAPRMLTLLRQMGAKLEGVAA